MESVLESKLPVLIYNGQNDLIVPSPGTIRMVNSLNWSSAASFNNQDFELWMLNGKNLG